MKTIYLSKDNIKAPSDKISICLGYFDGIHLGHQQIIKEALKDKALPVSVLTFDKPVSSFLANDKSKEVLTSLKDKESEIAKLGADYLLVMQIDKDFLSLRADEFVEILKKLNVEHIYVGDDYRFGKNKSGDVSLLKKSFDVTVVDTVLYKGEKVSTQRIISLVKDGDMESVNKMLNRSYRISGIVVEGHHNGEKLGIRTANIKMDANYALPKFGVYITNVSINGKTYKAITNVGVHPTIQKEKEPLIEVHIPNYKEIDYGKDISVEFLEFVREEKKFSSSKELVEQVRKDIALIF